jgi:hypothetical protein
MERKKLRNNMKMTLVNLEQEEAKSGLLEQQVDSALKKEEEAEKVLKADVNSQREAMQKRLIQRKRSRAASQGMNQTFSYSFG